MISYFGLGNLTGVWCTSEILLAIEHDYTVLQSYTQYDPVTQKGGLFCRTGQ